MADGSRRFIDTTAGKAIAAIVVLSGIIAAAWALKGSIGSSGDIASANERMFVDSKTGTSFNAELKAGQKFPIVAPSGGQTGYPAELCWWTKDGKVRSKPYGVLMNSWLDKPEPTFCPDCGRLVVPHNPAPDPANPTSPPPLQSEYKGSATDRER